MSNTRYLEITSEYRNRQQYPLPAQFNIDISQTGTKDKINALDPVSLATPTIIFAGQFDANTPAALFVSGSVISTVAAPVGGLGNTSSQQKIVIEFTAGDLVQTDKFYNGAIMIINMGANTEHRRIFDYEYVSTAGGVDRGLFTMERPYSDAVVSGDPVDIAIPSDNATTSGTAVMFIPTGSDADNFYINYILEDVTIAESRTITKYDGATHLASLNTPFGGGWAATDSFILRRESPCETGTLQNIAVPNANTTSFLTPAVSTTDFRGDFIRMTAASTANPNEVRRIVNYQAPINGVLAAGTTTTQFNLSAPFSKINNFYNGFYIEITSGAAVGDIRLITSYIVTVAANGTVTRVGTPASPFTAGILPGDTFTIKGGIVSPAMPATITGAGQTYEILCFSYENAVPFNYTGSEVSQQEMVCYEIELLNLVLPNQTLIVGKGSRITFYPYLYIELSNVSAASAGMNGILYSNNPNSTRMLFRAAMDDIPNPILSPFVKIDGDGTVNTVKFKPNDNLKFSVRLPSGEIFQTNDTETFSPSPPNPLIQISALFSLRRL